MTSTPNTSRRWTNLLTASAGPTKMRSRGAECSFLRRPPSSPPSVTRSPTDRKTSKMTASSLGWKLLSESGHAVSPDQVDGSNCRTSTNQVHQKSQPNHVDTSTNQVHQIIWHVHQIWKTHRLIFFNFKKFFLSFSSSFFLYFLFFLFFAGVSLVSY